MLKQRISPSNKKCSLETNFAVKCLLVFDLTQKHTSSHRSLRMSNGKNLISGFSKIAYVKNGNFLAMDCLNLNAFLRSTSTVTFWKMVLFFEKLKCIKNNDYRMDTSKTRFIHIFQVYLNFL